MGGGNFSVLMSVYGKEVPAFLNQSLESIFHQTVVPNEVIIVEDGPLNDGLYSVLERYSSAYPQIKRIKLDKNGGLGNALNIGLKHCSYNLVARMDTDDISRPNRFEKQIEFMTSHPEISVVSSWIDEFYDTPDNVISTRKLPEGHDDLVKMAVSRSPLNHPAVMFRKNDVVKCGSYLHFPLFEDYYLWARMIVDGFRIHNLQESLLLFRCSEDMFKRRGGLKYALKEVAFMKQLNKIGIASKAQTYKNIGIRFCVRILPNSLRSLFYIKFLR